MKLTYMDCWRRIAPLIPDTKDEISTKIYVMTFHALKQMKELEKYGVETVEALVEKIKVAENDN